MIDQDTLEKQLQIAAAPARLNEKSACGLCRNHYRDRGGWILCVERRGRIPRAILSGDRGCSDFRQRER